MATQCRSNRCFGKKQLIRIYTLLGSILIVGALCGFLFGRLTSPNEVKTVTITETVEVPIYTADKLPEVSDIFLYDVPLSESLQRYIYEICADEQIPVSLILAMIEHESGFNPEIVSATDDYGLMQINSVNHGWLEKDYRCADMLNPYQNVFCGVKIIGKYVEKYDGDYNKALMAYNMGDYGARKAWENGVESISYSTAVLDLMQKYEEVSHSADSNGA